MNIAELRESLCLELPTLRVSQPAGRTLVCGRLPVLAHDGTEIDNYQVEIELDKNHPKSPPVVREVGGRIPHTVDRHNPSGTACLFVPEEEWQFWDESTSLVEFIKDGPVRDFFFSQTYFEETGTWPFGERAHGLAGRVDYYLELLQTNSLQQVLRFLKLLASSRIPKGTLCYCGKLKRLSECHLEKILDIRDKIPRQRARYLLKKLMAIPWLAALSDSDLLQINVAETVPLARIMPSNTPHPRIRKRPRHNRYHR